VSFDLPDHLCAHRAFKRDTRESTCLTTISMWQYDVGRISGASGTVHNVSRCIQASELADVAVFYLARFHASKGVTPGKGSESARVTPFGHLLNRKVACCCCRKVACCCWLLINA